MSLSPGTRLGPYEIIAHIGAGGMGEVYRARDTRLDRSVAIKLLHAGVSEKPELRHRFEREARAVSSLNHAHICTLHDIGQQDGVDYLVMEYVEGTTLADLVSKARLPMDQVLRYGAELADALAAAHARGIVHRDLKPGNIMVTKAGIKILDFGLAKFNCLDGQTDSTATLTQSRVILGTPAYMAPEQLQGRQCDARTDIFALGLVLYEMATGRRAFASHSRGEVLPEIHGELQLDDLAARQFAHVVRRCVANDAASRWQAASDVKLELVWVQESHPNPLKPRRFRWIAAMAALTIAAGVGWWLFWRTPRPEKRPLVRLNVDLNLGSGLVSGFVWDRLRGAQATLAPDGSRIAFVTRDSDGQQRLATRLMDQPNITLLPETENAVDPFFSPNSQWLGFFSEGKLKKISIQGGAPVVLGDGFSNNRGASWGDDDHIVVSPNPVSDLLRLPAVGGQPEQLKGTSMSHWPQVLPGGRAVLVTRDLGNGTANVEVLPLGGGPTRVVAPGGYRGRYLPNGHLLFVHEGVLFGLAFDLEQLQPRGVPVALLNDVADDATFDLWGNPTFAAGPFDFDRNGTFFYFPGKLQPRKASGTLAWADAFGGTRSIPLAATLYGHPRISPDGKRLAIAAESNIWIIDFARNAPLRLTHKTIRNHLPEWAPDGQHLVYSGRTESSFGLWWTRADGGGEPQRLLESQSFIGASSIAVDGERIAFHQWTAKTGWDIWTLPIDLRDAERPKPGEPRVFLATPQDEVSASFSPDGRWIAYVSSDAGRRGIFVRPASEPGGPWQIASCSCIFPRWSGDGRKLYYLALGKGIMETSYTVQEGAFLAQETGIWSKAQTPQMSTATNFAVHPDGDRAVLVLAPETPANQNGNVQVTFLLNFLDEVSRRVAAGNR